MIYVSISEMFEHMKNYEKLLAKVANWLQPGGKLFVHIFTHKQFAYHFNKGKTNFLSFLLKVGNTDFDFSFQVGWPKRFSQGVPCLLMIC